MISFTYDSLLDFTGGKEVIATLAKGRISHQKYSMKKVILKNFSKFTGKHLCQNLFFNKFAGLKPAALFKKRLWERCFSVNFEKFLRTPFLPISFGWLLL